jgi:M3 family oligoendopeptidase
VGTPAEILANGTTFYSELSPETKEFWDHMMAHEMMDVESRPGKASGGYCTSIHALKSPFIFANFNGTDADVSAFTHEAGHAFAFFTAAKFQKTPQLCDAVNEIGEMHSMSMEFWTFPWLESFFGDKAEEYRKNHIVNALMRIPYRVSIDEFQHRVYQNPDMTSTERKALWREIERTYMPWRTYDGNAFLEQGGYWMQNQHIFLYPFYFIDYAIAQLAAFEFYTQMQKDRKAAWGNYYKLCQAGGSMGYFKLLEYCNLHNVLHEGSVKEALTAVFEELGV